MKRPRLDEESKSFSWWLKLFGRCTVSCIFVLLAQAALVLVPLFLPTSTLFLQLPLSASVLILVLGFGRLVRRYLGITGSAPAFVTFNILFMWGVYLFAIRKVVSGFMDLLFNLQAVLLVIGLFRSSLLSLSLSQILPFYERIPVVIWVILQCNGSIMFKDPGFFKCESDCAGELVESPGLRVQDESSISLKRIRYCKTCKAQVMGFDHHCSAFGNCIGQNNHLLFMVLLVGFLVTEASYVVHSSKFATERQIKFKTNHVAALARSTMLFCLLQILWQAVFLIWHTYCICFNITTDEWMNWSKYPEFLQHAESQLGKKDSEWFRNPYDKGIIQNVKRVLAF